MSKMMSFSYYLCFVLFCLTESNPIHDLRLEKTFIHEFSENLMKNMTELMGSNGYPTDNVANDKRDVHKCLNGIAKDMWLISLPYIKLTGQEMLWLDHRAIWINVKCADGYTIPLTVDFAELQGARRRFGFFNHNKIMLRGPDPLNLPVKSVYHATESVNKYNLNGYHCHHYTTQMYEKLLIMSQKLG